MCRLASRSGRLAGNSRHQRRCVGQCTPLCLGAASCGATRRKAAHCLRCTENPSKHHALLFSPAPDWRAPGKLVALPCAQSACEAAANEAAKAASSAIAEASEVHESALAKMRVELAVREQAAVEDAAKAAESTIAKLRLELSAQEKAASSKARLGEAKAERKIKVSERVRRTPRRAAHRCSKLQSRTMAPELARLPPPCGPFPYLRPPRPRSRDKSRHQRPRSRDKSRHRSRCAAASCGARTMTQRRACPKAALSSVPPGVPSGSRD